MNCPICSEPTSNAGAKFCSRACWLNHTRRRVEIRSCLVCGSDFIPSSTAIKAGMGIYCSRKCSGVGRRKDRSDSTRMTWYNTHGWQALSKRMRSQAGTCQECGGDDRLTVHHKRDPYPTRDVELLLRRSNLEVLCYVCHFRRHRPPVSSSCRHCGDRFEHAPSKSPKFCGARCRWAAQGRRRRRCGTCRQLFLPDRPEARFCSLKCAAASTAKIKHARRAHFVCPVCSASFTMPPCQARRNVARPCCSRRCAHELRRKHAS